MPFLVRQSIIANICGYKLWKDSYYLITYVRNWGSCLSHQTPSTVFFFNVKLMFKWFVAHDQHWVRWPVKLVKSYRKMQLIPLITSLSPEDKEKHTVWHIICIHTYDISYVSRHRSCFCCCVFKGKILHIFCCKLIFSIAPMDIPPVIRLTLSFISFFLIF